MALVQATLENELKNLIPVDTESEGIDNFTAAFESYFEGASVAGVSPNPGSLSSASVAMKAAMVGANSDGSLAIQNGITAFWGVVVSSYSMIWTTAPPLILVTPPPTLGNIKTALDTTFAANIAGELDLDASVAAVSAAIHPTQLGGIAIIGPPPPGGVPTPIL